MLTRFAPAHRTGQLDRTGVEQQLLGQRGLAGVGMGNDGEGATSPDLAFKLGLQRGI